MEKILKWFLKAGSPPITVLQVLKKYSHTILYAFLFIGAHPIFGYDLKFKPLLSGTGDVGIMLISDSGSTFSTVEWIERDICQDAGGDNLQQIPNINLY